MKTLASALWRLPQGTLIFLVNAYRLFLSPWLGSACRFEPSCSVFALQALRRHGATDGSYLTLRRLVRCQPWCAGGHDPVPAAGTICLFSRLLAREATISSKKMFR